MPYSDYSYLDPLHIVWRAGTEDDPYIDRVEYLKVLNHKVVLSEIPDRGTRVKIAGLLEINYDSIPKKSIVENEFSVNYATGVIELHQKQELNTLNIIYKGKGFIQYPSSRIYHQDEMNDVVESLESIINRSNTTLVEVSTQITEYQKIKTEVLDVTTKADTATTDAKNATEDAKEATEKALDAYDTTRLVFKPYVDFYSDIATTYPSPDVGWTTQVYDTGVRYRWDGISWIAIDLFGGVIPLATSNVDGLMSKADFSKLQKINEVVTSRKVIVFVLPSINEGKQGIFINYPFDGKIVAVKAICGTQGQTETKISIEKTTDMITWQNIMLSEIIIAINSNYDNGTATLSDDSVHAGEVFRLDVVQKGDNVQNITVEIIIEAI